MALLSPKEAALALGVSESSLKRWCDQGTLAAVKTAGGHRRLEAATIIDFARRSGRQIVKPEVLKLGVLSRRGQSVREASPAAFLEALLRGDEAGCRFLALSSLTSGTSMAEFGDRFVAWSFREIGQRWSHGETEVYEERRACQVCHSVLEHLAAQLPVAAATAPLAVGAAPMGDPYTLSTSLAALVLRQNGWRTQSLGNDLPWPTLIAAVRDLKPRLFWLSVSTVADQGQFVQGYRDFFTAVRSHTAVVVGGRAWTSDLRAQVSYAAHCDHLHHLETFAATLFRSRKARGATP
jgi:excisionase family DNA binding protein